MEVEDTSAIEGRRKELRRTIANLLKADKAESSLLVLFIPSVDRFGSPVNQDVWVNRSLIF